jgi:hypothetical protein
MKTIKKVLIFILCIFAVIGAASIALYIHPSMMQQPETKSTESIKVTKLGFEDIGELATQSAYCTIVKEVDESKKLFETIEIPFTQSKQIYSYDYTIKAGIDFSDVTYEIDDTHKTIHVHMPKIKILSNEVDPDSLVVYYQNESVFNRIPLEKNGKALKQMQEMAEENAKENGLFKNAEKNAEQLLNGFFKQAYPDYKIQYEKK